MDRVNLIHFYLEVFIFTTFFFQKVPKLYTNSIKMDFEEEKLNMFFKDKKGGLSLPCPK